MTQRTALAAFRRSILILPLFLFACLGDSDNSNEEIFGNSLLLNYTGNYESGELRWMEPDSTRLSTGRVSFNQDSKISAGGGTIFVLGNFPGTVACILPEEIGDESKIKQNALDAEAPYEVAVTGGKGYIALNDEDYVQVFNTSTCAPGEKINLPASDASSIKASGDTLLVVLQRLELFSATKPGLLVRIKASTKSVIDTIRLNFYNPSFSVLSKGKLYVSSQRYNEDYSVDLEKSGIEVVNLANGTSEILATGTQLGGGANGIALDDANQILYVSTYASWGDAPVKPFNLATKNIGTALPDIADSFGGLVFDNVAKKLFVGDVDFGNPGLKIYDPATKATTAVDEGANSLPPYSLAIVRW